MKSVVLAAKSEHSDNFIQRWVEPESSCRGPTLTCQTSLLPLPFNQPLDCWNQRILRHRSKHPTVISNLSCKANLRLCPSICLCFIEILSFGKKIHWYTDESSDCNYTWEELDKPKEFAAQGQALRGGSRQRFRCPPEVKLSLPLSPATWQGWCFCLE